MSTSTKSMDTRVGGSALVAVGMIGMNAGSYLLTLVAARVLVPKDFGALTALLGIVLVGTVASLGLQATTARRIAVAPKRTADIVASSTQVTIGAALVVAAIVALTSTFLTPLLHLESAWQVIFCGLTLLPFTIMGVQAGIAQGTSRWKTLTAIYFSVGFGRFVVGGIAIAIAPNATSAILGVAIGAWLPVIAGIRLLDLRHLLKKPINARSTLTEAFLGSHALLAFFVLSNMDAIIARNRFDVHISGLYASGLILAKAALMFPQFVSVVVFPDLARATSAEARLRAVAVVGGFGALAVGATALLPRVALILVGGNKYESIISDLWLFALAGSILAIVHLLTFDALARHAHGITVLLWVAVAAVAAIAYGLGVSLNGLIITMASVSAVLAIVVGLLPSLSRLSLSRRDRRAA